MSEKNNSAETEEMRVIVEKILSIDQHARNIVNNNERDIQEREIDARNRLDEFQNRITMESRMEGQARYEEIIRLAEEEAHDIESRKDQQIRILEQKFESIRNNLVNEIFNQVFLKEENGS